MSLSQLSNYNDLLAKVQGMRFMGEPVAEMDRQDLLYIIMHQEESRRIAARHLKASREIVDEVVQDFVKLRTSGPHFTEIPG